MADPGNPLKDTHSSGAVPAASSTKYAIAGILCTVYGLEELPADIQELACLWLLHPRLQDQETMRPIACQTVNHWNSRRSERGLAHGLIAVSFDQRNHGGRLVNALGNEAWSKGNHTHAQDMFSIFQGTAQDTSLLIRHIQSYLPAHLSTIPLTHHTLGISLGGHSAWQLAVNEPLIRTTVAVIGCPDFTRLMLHRAAKSRLRSFDAAQPAGFVGGPDFPPALVAEVDRCDPAAVLLPSSLRAGSGAAAGSVAADNLPRAAASLDKALAGKALFALSGADDGLVPYSAGAAFYAFLQTATAVPDGWWARGGCVFVERVYDGVRHEMTPRMAEDAVRFFVDEVLERTRWAGGLRTEAGSKL